MHIVRFVIVLKCVVIKAQTLHITATTDALPFFLLWKPKLDSGWTRGC